MASSWGISWGGSWGASWGDDVVVEEEVFGGGSIKLVMRNGYRPRVEQTNDEVMLLVTAWLATQGGSATWVR
jgi:hypothetical protein